MKFVERSPELLESLPRTTGPSCFSSPDLRSATILLPYPALEHFDIVVYEEASWMVVASSSNFQTTSLGFETKF